MLDIDKLRQQWIGKYVRTERVLTEEEFNVWVGKDFGWEYYPEYCFGGVGVVIGFEGHGGNIWILTDEGSSWIIDDQTTIMGSNQSE